MGLVEDKNIVKVYGIYEGDVFPTQHQDLLKSIHVVEDTEVRGGIYGKEITVNSNSKIWGEIFAKDSLSFMIKEGEIVLLSSISSKGSVTVNEKTENFDGYKLLIYGDVISKIVNLRDTLIIGSVFGDEVLIRNSFVIGTINASIYADLENVTSFAFYANDLRSAKNLTSVYTHSILGLSNRDFESIRWLPFCMAVDKEDCPENKIRCEKFINGTCSDYVKLDPVDKLNLDGLTVFTLIKRVAQLGKLKDTFTELFREYKMIFK